MGSDREIQDRWALCVDTQVGIPTPWSLNKNWLPADEAPKVPFMSLLRWLQMRGSAWA